MAIWPVFVSIEDTNEGLILKKKYQKENLNN